MRLSTGHAIRQARPGEETVVALLWREAGRWLLSQGIEQWQYPANPERIRQAIDSETCWVVPESDESDSLIATVTLDSFADPDFWAPDDDPQNALYVHRMIVDRSHAGKGIGTALLDWAAGQAVHAGKRCLRLDAWRDNQRLHRYYEGQGFTLVRIVEAPHRKSGALFERKTTCAQ